MTTLWDSVKKSLKDGAKIAKEGATIAAEKAEEFSKKSKVMFDISNIKRKIEKSFTEIGGKAYHLIVEENVKDISENEEVQTLLENVKKLEDELNTKQEEYNNIGIAIKDDGEVVSDETVEDTPEENKEEKAEE